MPESDDKRTRYNAYLPKEKAEWVDKQCELRFMEPTVLFERGIDLLRVELEKMEREVTPLPGAQK